MIFYAYARNNVQNAYSIGLDRHCYTPTPRHPMVGFLKLANPIKDTCTLSSFFLKDLPCCDPHPRLQSKFHSTLHKTSRTYYQECMKFFWSLNLEYRFKSTAIISICCCQSLVGSLRLRGCLQRLNICIAQMTCLKK